MSHSDEGWREAGGEIDRVRVSLRFSGNDLDPEVVSRALGVAPTLARRKGEAPDEGRAFRQPTGVWYLELPESNEWILGDAIEELLRRVPAPAHVCSELALRYDGEVFCGLLLGRPNRGAVIEPRVLALLAERSLSIDLDIYAPHQPS